MEVSEAVESSKYKPFNLEEAEKDWFNWSILGSRCIRTYGVIAEVLTNCTHYEAIVFDDVSNSTCFNVYLESDGLRVNKKEVFNFKVLTDTLVSFDLVGYYSPDIYDFQLIIYPDNINWK